ncbi:hypothetical protein MMC09_006929 [Bachmanniomyces sp. S44760]|nr:hypothetical protein [Bachmanniomyces sp. S44760]
MSISQSRTGPDIQVPEWERPRDKVSANGHGANGVGHHAGIYLRTRSLHVLDKIIPAHRQYFGQQRRTFLIILGIIMFLLVALVIGLAAGLSVHPRSQNLPLPSNSQPHTGDLTYYDPALGSCGVMSTGGEMVFAVSHSVFDSFARGSNPNANPLCGRRIRASRFDEQANAQRSVDLTLVDRCVGCNPTDIDVSPAAFAELADPGAGRVTVTWAWLEPLP